VGPVGCMGSSSGLAEHPSPVRVCQVGSDARRHHPLAASGRKPSGVRNPGQSPGCSSGPAAATRPTAPRARHCRAPDRAERSPSARTGPGLPDRPSRLCRGESLFRHSQLPRTTRACAELLGRPRIGGAERVRRPPTVRRISAVTVRVGWVWAVTSDRCGWFSGWRRADSSVLCRLAGLTGNSSVARRRPRTFGPALLRFVRRGRLGLAIETLASVRMGTLVWPWWSPPSRPR
jgi:hypothetical protein